MIRIALVGVLQINAVTDGATPAPRYGHRAVYSERHGGIVVFGGRTVGKKSLGDTWLFDGRWRRLSTSGPSPRAWPGIAYDAQRRVIVLFGGRDSTNRPLSDVWELDGTRWSQRGLATGPRARDHHAMTYDPSRVGVVVHGGDGGGEDLGDAWLLDARGWTALDTVGPGRRAAHQMVYVPSRRTLLLHGGLRPRDTTSVEVLGDSWELAAAGWRLLDARAEPRSHFGLAFWDACDCVVRVAGGDGSRTPVATTELLRGSSWSAFLTSGPSARVDQPLVQLGKGGPLFLFGGYVPTPGGEVFGDAWRLRMTSAAWESVGVGDVRR